MQETDKTLGYFDQPKTKKLLWRLLWAICILSLALEFFVHRNNHFELEKFTGFYAALGFIACSISILAAKGIGFFLKKDEGYYDDK